MPTEDDGFHAAVHMSRKLALVRPLDDERHLDNRRGAPLRQLGLLETDHGTIGSDKFDLEAIDALEDITTSQKSNS